LGFERDRGGIERIRGAVREADPELVLVGLGFPKQEYLISELRPVCPQAWFIGVGISLSFLAGDVRRAPRWMQACGLEWLHRFWQEPGRLAKRYFVHGLPFGVRLLVGAALERRLRGRG
jgi:N-acetylglucosaminyldiphosphoundecaprenol N-acetyl-beta-D-mannosaminyltransferase